MQSGSTSIDTQAFFQFTLKILKEAVLKKDVKGIEGIFETFEGENFRKLVSSKLDENGATFYHLAARHLPHNSFFDFMTKVDFKAEDLSLEDNNGNNIAYYAAYNPDEEASKHVYSVAVKNPEALKKFFAAEKKAAEELEKNPSFRTRVSQSYRINRYTQYFQEYLANHQSSYCPEIIEIFLANNIDLTQPYGKQSTLFTSLLALKDEKVLLAIVNNLSHQENLKKDGAKLLCLYEAYSKLELTTKDPTQQLNILKQAFNFYKGSRLPELTEICKKALELSSELYYYQPLKDQEIFSHIRHFISEILNHLVAKERHYAPARYILINLIIKYNSPIRRKFILDFIKNNKEEDILSVQLDDAGGNLFHYAAKILPQQYYKKLIETPSKQSDENLIPSRIFRNNSDKHCDLPSSYALENKDTRVLAYLLDLEEDFCKQKDKFNIFVKYNGFTTVSNERIKLENRATDLHHLDHGEPNTSERTHFINVTKILLKHGADLTRVKFRTKTTLLEKLLELDSEIFIPEILVALKGVHQKPLKANGPLLIQLYEHLIKCIHRKPDDEFFVLSLMFEGEAKDLHEESVNEIINRLMLLQNTEEKSTKENAKKTLQHVLNWALKNNKREIVSTILSGVIDNQKQDERLSDILINFIETNPEQTVLGINIGSGNLFHYAARTFSKENFKKLLHTEAKENLHTEAKNKTDIGLRLVQGAGNKRYLPTRFAVSNPDKKLFVYLLNLEHELALQYRFKINIDNDRAAQIFALPEGAKDTKERQQFNLVASTLLANGANLAYKKGENSLLEYLLKIDSEHFIPLILFALQKPDAQVDLKNNPQLLNKLYQDYIERLTTNDELVILSLIESNLIKEINGSDVGEELIDKVLRFLNTLSGIIVSEGESKENKDKALALSRDVIAAIKKKTCFLAKKETIQGIVAITNVILNCMVSEGKDPKKKYLLMIKLIIENDDQQTLEKTPFLYKDNKFANIFRWAAAHLTQEEFHEILTAGIPDSLSEDARKTTICKRIYNDTFDKTVWTAACTYTTDLETLSAKLAYLQEYEQFALEQVEKFEKSTTDFERSQCAFDKPLCDLVRKVVEQRRVTGVFDDVIVKLLQDTNGKVLTKECDIVKTITMLIENGATLTKKHPLFGDQSTVEILIVRYPALFTKLILQMLKSGKLPELVTNREIMLKLIDTDNDFMDEILSLLQAGKLPDITSDPEMLHAIVNIIQGKDARALKNKESHIQFLLKEVVQATYQAETKVQSVHIARSIPVKEQRKTPTSKQKHVVRKPSVQPVRKTRETKKATPTQIRHTPPVKIETVKTFTASQIPTFLESTKIKADATLIGSAETIIQEIENQKIITQKASVLKIKGDALNCLRKNNLKDLGENLRKLEELKTMESEIALGDLYVELSNKTGDEFEKLNLSKVKDQHFVVKLFTTSDAQKKAQDLKKLAIKRRKELEGAMKHFRKVYSFANESKDYQDYALWMIGMIQNKLDNRKPTYDSLLQAFKLIVKANPYVQVQAKQYLFDASRLDLDEEKLDKENPESKQTILIARILCSGTFSGTLNNNLYHWTNSKAKLKALGQEALYEKLIGDMDVELSGEGVNIVISDDAKNKLKTEIDVIHQKREEARRSIPIQPVATGTPEMGSSMPSSPVEIPLVNQAQKTDDEEAFKEVERLANEEILAAKKRAVRSPTVTLSQSPNTLLSSKLRGNAPVRRRSGNDTRKRQAVAG